jgi:hypothetical protein
MTMRQEIVDACAWTLWAQAWVSLQEELGAAGVNPGAGGSWDPYVPDVPEDVTKGAEKLIASMERMNGATVDALYTRACTGKKVQTPERFGSCLGYQAAGAGVGIGDDFDDTGIKVPEIMVNAYSDTGADVGGVDERFAR